MGKKNRQRKKTIYGIVEGNAEFDFLTFLYELYGLELDNLNNSNGGDPSQMIAKACKNQHFDICFAWIDEDKPINKECQEILEKTWNLSKDSLKNIEIGDLSHQFNRENKKKPIIIISPVCFDTIILRLFNKTPPHTNFDVNNRDQQILDLKNAVRPFIPNYESRNKFYEYCQANLTKDKLQILRLQIPQLDVILMAIEKASA